MRNTSQDLEEEGAGALPIHNMEGERNVFHSGLGAYIKDLKPFLSYPSVIWKEMERFPWRVWSLSGRPKTKYVKPTSNMEAEGGVFYDRSSAYLNDIKPILPCQPEI